MRLAGNGVSAEVLRLLQRKGADSAVLRCRLEFAEVDSFRRYLAQVAGTPRAHPDMLPTQASGRWSTTNPPIINFPDNEMAAQRGLPPIREVFQPDPGRYWLKWDWDAVEGRLGAAYFEDLVDIETFNKGWDIHTLTAAAVFKFSAPPNRQDPHGAAENADWRRAVKWAGKSDRRRHIAKTLRYALQYGTNEYSIRQSPAALALAESLGITMQQLLHYARAYLKNKAVMVAAKQRIWKACRESHMARTFLGRRRVLVGDAQAIAREGLNHMIQGAVADMMNAALIGLLGGAQPLLGPESWLVYNAHDGAAITLPDDVPAEEAIRLARPVVERAWQVDAHLIQFPATWSVVRGPA